MPGIAVAHALQGFSFAHYELHCGNTPWLEEEEKKKAPRLSPKACWCPAKPGGVRLRAYIALSGRAVAMLAWPQAESSTIHSVCRAT